MKFYESEYEKALITLLQEEGWDYTLGSKLHRHRGTRAAAHPLSRPNPKGN